MSSDRSEDDDPTRALDDFVRRMRPAATPAASAAPDLADLSDLVARLHPERTATAPRPRGGTLRNGQTWRADEVEDVPLVELPRQPSARSAPPQVDLPEVDLRAEGERAAQAPEISLPPVVAPPPPREQDIVDAVLEARDLAADQQRAEAAAQAAPAWQPDLTTLQLRRASDPRLLTTWQPGAWIGAVRQVVDSTTEFVKTADGNPTVETWPPHRLLLLWPPQGLDKPVLGRWPQQLRLSAVPQDQSTEALLADLPADACLWLHGQPQDIDWGLAAETLLHHQAELRPFQAEGLRTFIAAERETSYARLNSGYQLAADGGVVRTLR